MGEENQFDAVVVGAGPAGLACAYLLAKAGKAVLIIERGDAPGAKNVTGGRIYAYALNLLDQELLEDAAWDRKVSHEEIMIIDGKRSITIDYHDPSLTEGTNPFNHTLFSGRCLIHGWPVRQKKWEQC